MGDLNAHTLMDGRGSTKLHVAQILSYCVHSIDNPPVLSVMHFTRFIFTSCYTKHQHTVRRQYTVFFRSKACKLTRTQPTENERSRSNQFCRSDSFDANKNAGGVSQHISFSGPILRSTHTMCADSTPFLSDRKRANYSDLTRSQQTNEIESILPH